MRWRYTFPVALAAAALWIASVSSPGTDDSCGISRSSAVDCRPAIPAGTTGPAVAAAPAVQPAAPAAPAAAPAPEAAPAPVVRVLASAVTRKARPSEAEIKDLASALSSEVLLSRGFSHYWAGRYTEALAHFEGALVNDKANPQAWYGKALAERALGETASATASLAEAARLHQDVQIPDSVFGFMMERLPTAEKSWVAAARNR